MGKNYVFENFQHLLHGADYNPEQWADYEGVWDEDMRLFSLANMNELTVGMFSWAVLEKEEGVFDFSVFDEVLDRVYANGGRIIMSTPSGARPLWLAKKYPEVLRVGADGVRNDFGGRHNHCFTSPAYREKVRIINEKLAERYGNHPAVIGWHLSNEYGGECHCPLCRQAFRDYLKEKYNGDIAALNHDWWTTFWSHKYCSFDDIEEPHTHGENGVHGLNLEWRRFVTRQAVDFMKAEAEAVRKFSDKPITTNMMWGFYDYDYFKFRDVLDFASWDAYPEWGAGRIKAADDCAFWHDFYRSLKKNKPFLLMESTPSLVNWHEINRAKRPGEDTLASLQAIARGADSVQYFQFRASRGSSEKFHGAVVMHDGTEHTRTFRAVQKTGDILKKVDEICGTLVQSRVAILMDWESMWALDDCQGYLSKNKGYLSTLYAYHKYFIDRSINVDIVNPKDDLSPYSLVIAPMLYMTDEQTIESLTNYVSGGGTLFSTYIFGVVNGTDLCHLGGKPGGTLKDVFGLTVEETDTLYPDARGEVVMSGKPFITKDFCDVITNCKAQILATYNADFYSGSPAYTVNDYGKGKAYYQAFRSDDDFIAAALDNVTENIGIAPNAVAPAGVQVTTRTDGKNEYLFILNFTDEEQKVLINGLYADLLNNSSVRGEVAVNPLDFKILKKRL